MNKFFTLSSGKSTYARFVVGNGKSATYEVGCRGMNRRIDVANGCYTFHPAEDFTTDSSLLQHALNEAETVETLNALFAQSHAEYVAFCEKYGVKPEAGPEKLTRRVQWIGVDGAVVELATA